MNVGIGGVAGACGALAVYPIDLVKTRLQSSAGAACYGNGIDAARQLLATEGPLAFYKGVGPQLVGVAPEKTIKLVVNDAIRGLWAGGPVPLLGEVAAGASAGLCQVIVTNPLEIVKVRLQLAGGQLGWSSVVQELGLSGLYTGAPYTLHAQPYTLQPYTLSPSHTGAAACASRDSVFSAILFPAYAHIKPLVASALPMPNIFATCFIAGVAAATPAAILTTPLDVVKTRQQQGCGLVLVQEDGCLTTPPAAPSGCEVEAPTFLAALQAVLREEGASTLFSGALERFLRSSPQFGVTLAVFELLKEVLLE